MGDLQSRPRATRIAILSYPSHLRGLLFLQVRSSRQENLRWRRFGSASLPPQPATSTSVAPEPLSSTGFSRNITRESSSFALKTRMWSVRLPKWWKAFSKACAGLD